MNIITLNSKKTREIIDITDMVNDHFRGTYPKAGDGLLHLFLPHTSAAISVASLEPGTDQDYVEAFQIMEPKIHLHNVSDPESVPARIIASIIKPGFAVPVVNGTINLGLWQRIVFIELSGPQEREIYMTFLNAAPPQSDQKKS